MDCVRKTFKCLCYYDYCWVCNLFFLFCYVWIFVNYVLNEFCKSCLTPYQVERFMIKKKVYTFELRNINNQTRVWLFFTSHVIRILWNAVEKIGLDQNKLIGCCAYIVDCPYVESRRYLMFNGKLFSGWSRRNNEEVCERLMWRTGAVGSENKREWCVFARAKVTE